MSRVGIVTDSTNSLPAELIKEYDIRVGSVTMVIDGKVYRDQIDISNEEFFRMQKNLKEMPTTSSVITGDFVDIFRDLSKSTDSIACFPHSSRLGATHDSAVQASEIIREELPDLKIKIVDTKTATGALGLIALEAARAAWAGKNLDEVIAVANDVIPRAKWIATLDTLKYLIKGGRAPKAAGLFAELIKMKPIVGMVNGTGIMDFSDKARTKSKAMTRMIEISRQYMKPDKRPHIIVQYSDNIEEGEKLKEMVAAEFDCAELYMTQWTPVMCCHVGPLVGLAFYC